MTKDLLTPVMKMDNSYRTKQDKFIFKLLYVLFQNRVQHINIKISKLGFLRSLSKPLKNIQICIQTVRGPYCLTQIAKSSFANFHFTFVRALDKWEYLMIIGNTFC